MSRLTNFDQSKPHFVIPPHCVIRPDSLTTKLRVVFDGSAKTSSGKSLNNILMTGPTRLNYNSSAFRLHKYALTGDIWKMYRQLIHRRTNVTDLLTVYQLNTVTYGLASSLF